MSLRLFISQMFPLLSLPASSCYDRNAFTNDGTSLDTVQLSRDFFFFGGGDTFLHYLYEKSFKLIQHQSGCFQSRLPLVVFLFGF